MIGVLHTSCSRIPSIIFHSDQASPRFCAEANRKNRLMTFFSEICQQIMPQFVRQRSLYEARERPSKTYSWKAFVLSNILVEIPYSFVCSLLIFICWYYPIGLYRNAEPTNAVHERGVLSFLFVFAFILFASSFAHMFIAAIGTAETAGNLTNLLFILMLMFCGCVNLVLLASSTC